MATLENMKENIIVCYFSRVLGVATLKNMKENIIVENKGVSRCIVLKEVAKDFTFFLTLSLIDPQ